MGCMDLEAYLVSNWRMRAFNTRWRCPICSIELQPANLCIDEYVQHILATTGPEIDKVLVALDGAWRSEASASASVDDVADAPPELQPNASDSSMADQVEVRLARPLCQFAQRLKQRLLARKRYSAVTKSSTGGGISRGVLRLYDNRFQKPAAKGRQAANPPHGRFQKPAARGGQVGLLPLGNLLQPTVRGGQITVAVPGSQPVKPLRGRFAAAARRAARISAMQSCGIAVDSDADEGVISDDADME